ncbi:uncharacterized protein LOC128675466 [Plodia interpunctella]|uniref:uncharacterized protein LOC128675466 n=1 Tax=Plodia interpunctella TaxID=58824 RepID=UPI002367F174|nr:uncharacterized protein LOC128675466 [Plodia interpunctella]
MEGSAFILVIFCGLFKYGSAIICYECNSATNPLCEEKVLPDSLKRNCSDLDRGVTHTLCRKIIQYVDYGINGQRPSSRVVRTCGWDETKYKGTCYHRSGYGGRQEVCTCTKDLCNDGHVTHVSTAILLTTISVFILK